MKKPSHKSILAVDGDPRLLIEIMERLSQAGFHVHTVTHASTALRLIQTRSFDAVILEATSSQLPAGLALISALGNSTSTAKTLIILLDATSDSGLAEEYRELGCEHFLPKPLDLDGLCHLLNSAFSTNALAEIELLSRRESQRQV
ncbi:MAG: response regulator [Planctomycetota bacterium]